MSPGVLALAADLIAFLRVMIDAQVKNVRTWWEGRGAVVGAVDEEGEEGRGSSSSAPPAPAPAGWVPRRLGTPPPPALAPRATTVNWLKRGGTPKRRDRPCVMGPQAQP